MNGDLVSLIDRFARLRVLVIGEGMLDSYLEGSTGRLCREAPVPVVNLTARRDIPGGAANTALNVHTLGARVTFVSVVGEDVEGGILRETLETGSLDTGHVLAGPGRATLAKHRVVADSQILVRYDQGSTGPVDETTDAELVERVEALAPEHDAVLISDYGYGVVSSRLVAVLEGLRARWPGVLVVDSRHLERYAGLRPDAVKPNWEEACVLLGLDERVTDRHGAITRESERLLDVTGARAAAVTLDGEGTVLVRAGEAPYLARARRFRHASVAGAGDTFSAAMTLALAAGGPPEAAVDLGSAAASVVVGKEATACCSASELRQALWGSDKYVTDLRLLVDWCAACRRDGRRIVFTNGCFDILHSGHISYLNQARAEGDVLIVGLNSDESVRRLKGPERPINTLDDRASVLAALTSVDFVVPFEEDTPAELIRAVRPDVFVKGGDYTEQTLPEAPLVRELGGRIAFMPFVDDRSTSLVIERIREAEERKPAGRRPDGGSRRVGGGKEAAMRPAR